ncbi:MAG: hydroxymethylbilane synthase [Chloroflexia bacterium]|nr:hydroxymethylbilane synthase [Chloroflexia bacterium]
MTGSGPRPRFGTRGSALALAQTERVLAMLRARVTGFSAETVVIRTEGDVDKTTPLAIIGGRGVFTSALQEALQRGEIDAAVHSAKDLPTERPVGLELAAFPEREDPRDVLVSRHRLPLAELPARPLIGTSSRRRAVQVQRLRPDARIVDLRGNIDTRLRQALTADFDAIVLAAAGVRRMGWDARITELLPLDQFVPSPGQGALAVEARTGDDALGGLLALVNDAAIAHAVGIERAFLRAVGGGCTKPIGAHVTEVAEGWRLLGMIAADDGAGIAFADEMLDLADPAAHATAIARELLARVTPTPAGRLEPALGSPQEAMPLPPTPAVATVISLPVITAVPALAGVRVLVTRPRARAAPLVDALRAEGAVPVEVPTIRIEDTGESAALDRALAALVVGDYDWVVFTSVNAVERLLDRLRRRGQGWPLGRAVRVVAVGRVTAAALEAAAIAVDLIPKETEGEGVVTIMARHYIAGQRVLYPKGDQARNVIPVGLRRAGATVDAVEVYRTVPERVIDPAIRDQISRGEVDVVTFASPSSVRGLTMLLGGAAGLARMDVICVGAVTADAARAQGLAVHGIARDASVAGIVAALVARRAAGAAIPAKGDPDE